MEMTRTEYMYRCRGIRKGDECQKCNGAGTVMYGSTSTWRGGIGGSAMTHDVCDKCWGSGSRFKTWADLRAVEAELKRLRKLCNRAADWMRDEAFAYPPDVTTGAELQDELRGV